MKVVLCHNYYQQPGGEDLSFAQEAGLLESRGHQVIRYIKHNDELARMGALAAAGRAVWNNDSYRELRALICRERPDVAHFTNTFPLISPAAYYAAKSLGVAVVQSLRNYRLLCPGAYLVRDGKVCESCLGRSVAWPGVVHGCYRGSRPATLAVASMLAYHRWRRTWTQTVDMYYALTEVSRAKFIQGGLPADRIAVKPNFIEPAPEPGSGACGHAVFAGRLSPEKGIDVMLAAWSRLPVSLPLIVAGDGPLASTVAAAAERDSRIQWRRRLPPEETMELIGTAACLIMPSLWYEGFPRTILEAFAKGTPVIASRLGSMAEIVDDPVTGLHFTPGDPDDLVRAILQALADPDKLAQMRGNARRTFLAKYNADANYRKLMRIYARALGRPAPVFPPRQPQVEAAPL